MSRIRVRPLQISWIAIFVCIFVTAISAYSKNQTSQTQAQSTQSSSTQTQNPPSNTSAINKIDGGVGACSANFNVRDGQDKPIYNAQISTELRYGFMNMRKTDLKIGTDSNGKAEITGLPNFPKKPIVFHIKTGTVAKDVTDDPESKCNASFDVVFAVR